MPAKQYLVNLTQDEREQLLGISRRGKSSARKVKWSLILCKAAEGATERQVAEALMVGPPPSAECASGSWKGGWSLPSMTGRGLGKGASLMGSKNPLGVRGLQLGP